MERKGGATMKGNPLTLIGDELKVGDNIHDCELLDNDLNPVKLSSFRGKVCIISSVPSLDTPVCDTETKRFNKEAEKLGNDVVLLTVSMDLPFAQKRWCGSEGVNNVKTLSDHSAACFGNHFGVLIKELRLLGRCVWVVDKEGSIRNIHMVKEITEEPNYDEIIEQTKKLL